MDNQVVGLIEIECETEPKSICSTKDSLGGMIWNIAVHPDYQRMGIGEKLLDAAIEEAKNVHLTYLQAWTRDDAWVQMWYEKMNFKQTTSYYHLFFEGIEMDTLSIPERACLGDGEGAQRVHGATREDADRVFGRDGHP